MKNPHFRHRLRSVFDVLHAHHGPQYWWPGETSFEIMVGAVLTQNTAWSNVEKAIGNLVDRNKLDAAAIVAARKDHLAGWLRPSGYFNVKAARLKNFCRWYLQAGGFGVLDRMVTGELRLALLGVNGVGKETADDILLYAFNRPVFVIDAYTRRLFARLGLFSGDEDYDCHAPGHRAGAWTRRAVIQRVPCPDCPACQGYLPCQAALCRVRPEAVLSVFTITQVYYRRASGRMFPQTTASRS